MREYLLEERLKQTTESSGCLSAAKALATSFESAGLDDDCPEEQIPLVLLSAPSRHRFCAEALKQMFRTALVAETTELLCSLEALCRESVIPFASEPFVSLTLSLLQNSAVFDSSQKLVEATAAFEDQCAALSAKGLRIIPWCVVQTRANSH